MSLTLKSSDGKLFTVDLEIVKHMEVINSMLEDLGMDESDEEVVPLTLLNSTVLEQVIEWVTNHQEPPSDETKVRNAEELLESKDVPTIVDLILAADFLGIPHLVSCGCKAVAMMMEGSECEEMRKKFAVSDPEEEESGEIEDEEV